MIFSEYLFKASSSSGFVPIIIAPLVCLPEDAKAKDSSLGIIDERAIEIDGEFETLQGLIMSKLDRLPTVGDVLYIKPHQFTVSKMRKNQILTVVVESLPQEEDDSLEDE